MGQYFKVVNLDRHEWFDPNAFEESIKHPERAPRTMEALGRLLMPGGAWCGDRIAIVGDESAEIIGETGAASCFLDEMIEQRPSKWKHIGEQIGGRRYVYWDEEPPDDEYAVKSP